MKRMRNNPPSTHIALGALYQYTGERHILKLILQRKAPPMWQEAKSRQFIEKLALDETLERSFIYRRLFWSLTMGTWYHLALAYFENVWEAIFKKDSIHDEDIYCVAAHLQAFDAETTRGNWWSTSSPASGVAWEWVVQRSKWEAWWVAWKFYCCWFKVEGLDRSIRRRTSGNPRRGQRMYCDS